MVQLFKVLFKDYKKWRVNRGNTFLDTLRLTVKGGHGGNGLPKYGGIGGQGGCVNFLAKNDVTLRQIINRYEEKRVAASNGEDSSKIRILGRRGLDVTVEVPPGIKIYDDNGELIGELNEPGKHCVVAGGGMGGCAKYNFLGQRGKHRVVNLDLKLIADIGLVGFPNAGKSTFLKSISNAKPKIASYPFTTIRPQIGMIIYDDYRCISLADLPGLIEGAHTNYGMGHKFLKHVERTRLLIFMVDIFGFCLSYKHKHRDCLHNIYALNKELELYDSSLLLKPSILLLNKMDKDGANEILKSIKPMIDNLESNLEKCPPEIRPEKLLKFEKIIPISAKNISQVFDIKNILRTILDEWSRSELPDESTIQKMLQHKLDNKSSLNIT